MNPAGHRAHAPEPSVDVEPFGHVSQVVLSTSYVPALHFWHSYISGVEDVLDFKVRKVPAGH